MVTEHLFDETSAMIDALSSFVSSELNAAVLARASAGLVVSGGKTPRALFRGLSKTPLDWEKICITLADERWVGASDPDSNEHLVRTTLLRDAAKAARFVGLKNTAASPEESIAATLQALKIVPHPFDLVLLGLGEDGHTASLFPGAPELSKALAKDAPACIVVHPPAAAHTRISLSAAALLDSRAIAFLIEGPEKWAAYQRACEPGPIEQYPSRAFLHQEEVPVHVYWSK